MKHTQLHLLYIITKLELGGAQKVCLQLFQGMQKHDVNTSLISGSEGRLLSELDKTDNIILLDTLTREVKWWGIIKELYCFYALVCAIRKQRKAYPNLIVHTHSTKAGHLGRWAAWLAGVTYRVHTIHGYAFHDHQPTCVRLLIKLLEWFTGLITTHYICVSQEDLRIGTTFLPNFAKRHTLIRAAVDPTAFYVPARTCIPFTADTPFIFGTIACFKKQKNLFDLLEAFAHVYARNKRARLELIGDGILRSEIETWIAKHNVQEVITLHGWQLAVAPIMLNWHAFVLSSLWEGLPCAIIEARLLKLPVISYATGGIADVIRSGHNGILCKQKDLLSLAHAMLELSERSDIYTTLSAHQEDLTAFTTDVMIKQHLEVYNKLHVS